MAAPAWRASAEAGYAAALARAYGGQADPGAALARLAAAAEAAQARADRLLRALGLRDGPVAERFARLSADPVSLYADTSEGRDRAVAYMNARLAALRPRLLVAFGDLPIAPAQVRRMSPADEAAGRGGYRVPPGDGQPGVYYADLHAVRARPAWTLPSVAFHEVTPGHLLQMPLEAAAHPAPARAKAAGAFFEAWAIYAEELSAELGAYRRDARGEVGYLHWRLFRLARGMADIGLHTLGWSGEEAISRVAALQGFPAAFVGIPADVARIAANPGKVAAEALGALDLTDWRPKDRAKWPAYHRMLLTEAPWPFGELEERLFTGGLGRGGEP